MSTAPALLAMLLLLPGCNRVVEQRAYAADGQLNWSVVMPGTRNTALWLSYSLSAPASRTTKEGEAVPNYDLSGHLYVSGGGRSWYNGSIFLRPEGIAVDRVYTPADREDVERECGYSTCTERGRLKLLQLHEVPSGTLLEVDSSLPPELNQVTLLSAALQLAPN